MVSKGPRAAVALVTGIVCVAATIVWSITGTAEPPAVPTNCRMTAAESRGWGAPRSAVDFDDDSSLSNWYIYDGTGNAGNGRRVSSAVTLSDGLLTVTGDEHGNSGGMAWRSGQMYGRWEVCAKSPPSAETYHSVLLLWPDAENWPVGGEIDFMEISDPLRQSVDAYLHFGSDDQREGGNIQADASQWHSWAVEWTPDRIATYIDGVQWWVTTDAQHFPPGPMHLCMQLDNFGGDTRGGGQQIVDWVRQYSIG